MARPELGDGDGRLGEQLEQERLELVVGPVDLVDQQHRRARPRVLDRLQQRPGDQVVGAEQVGLVDGRALRLGQPDRQQLARVVPLVERLGSRRCPRSTAAAAAGCRARAPAPWPPRSCRRRPRPRAGSAAAARPRRTARWRARGRRGSRPRRAAAAGRRRRGRAAASRTSRRVRNAPGRRRTRPRQPGPQNQ